jgi:hypothetical protein
VGSESRVGGREVTTEQCLPEEQLSCVPNFREDSRHVPLKKLKLVKGKDL